MDLSEVFSRYGPYFLKLLFWRLPKVSRKARHLSPLSIAKTPILLWMNSRAIASPTPLGNHIFATKQTRPTAIPTNHHHAQKQSSAPSHYTRSSSSTDPMTPHGFSAPASVVIQGVGGSLSLFDPSTSYDSDFLIKFLAGHASSHGYGSPFSIFPGHTEELTPSADVLDTINHDLLSSIFGETLNRQKGVWSLVQ